MPLNKKQILALGAGRTINKPQLLHILGLGDNMLTACRSALVYIDKHPDSDHDLSLVWRDCLRPDWWHWLITNIVSSAQPDAYLHINEIGYQLHLRDFHKMFDKFGGEWNLRAEGFDIMISEEVKTPTEWQHRRIAHDEENDRLLAEACRSYLPNWDTIIVPGLLVLFRSRSYIWREHRNANL